jgi:hypothetical protein
LGSKKQTASTDRQPNIEDISLLLELAVRQSTSINEHLPDLSTIARNLAQKLRDSLADEASSKERTYRQTVIATLDEIAERASLAGELLNATDPTDSLIHFCKSIGLVNVDLSNISETEKGVIDRLNLLTAGYTLGLAVGQSTSLSGAFHWFAGSARRSAASRKGGAATAKWTPEVDKMARSIYAEVKSSGASKEFALIRTAALLKQRHDITISRSTIQRHINLPPRVQR